MFSALMRSVEQLFADRRNLGTTAEADGPHSADGFSLRHFHRQSASAR